MSKDNPQLEWCTLAEIQEELIRRKDLSKFLFVAGDDLVIGQLDPDEVLSIANTLAYIAFAAKHEEEGEA